MPPLTPAPDVPVEAYEASQDPANWVDHYVRMGLIGTGGMSAVYRAFDTQWRMEVALKFLNAHQDGDLLAHGAREGRITASLKHPAIPRVYREGTHQGQTYLAMQLIRGTGLATYRPRDAREMAEILRTVALAVHEAHQLGVFHRDINPENIMVEERVESGTRVLRPYLLDFGVAQLREERLTVKGAAIGKKRYMSPEQLENRIDARSDVYALGATLYSVATGLPPFFGTGDTALDDSVRHQDPLAPRRLNPALPRDLETVILVAMDKDSERRYPSAAAFASALERFLNGEDVGPRPSVMRRIARRLRRHRVTLAIAAVCVAFAAATGSYAWHRLSLVSASEEEPWILRYDLDKDPAGSLWKRVVPDGGPPLLQEGALRIAGEGDVIVRSTAEFPGDVRLEYDATVRGDVVCDASCYVNADEFGIGNGYFIGLGSDLNTRAKLIRANRIVAVNPAFRLEKGRRHHILVERDESGVRAWVDGVLVIDYADFLPLDGSEARVGFYIHHSDVEFSKVRVYTRQVPERTVKLRHADRLFAARDYASAVRIYGELPRTPEIEFKRAVALFRLHRDGSDDLEVRETLTRLANTGPPKLRPQAARALTTVLLAARRFDEALAIVAAAGDDSRRYELLRAWEESFDEALVRGERDHAVAMADAVMTRHGTAVVRTLGSSNFRNYLPLTWALLLLARGKVDESLALQEDLARVAGGSPSLRFFIAHRLFEYALARRGPEDALTRIRRVVAEFEKAVPQGTAGAGHDLEFRLLLHRAEVACNPKLLEEKVAWAKSVSHPMENWRLLAIDYLHLAAGVIPEDAHLPDTSLMAGRYDAVLTDPLRPYVRADIHLLRMLARLARDGKQAAWQEIAAFPAIPSHTLWREFFTERISGGELDERLALIPALESVDPAFWIAVRHELHSRTADARTVYTELIRAGRLAAPFLQFAKGR